MEAGGTAASAARCMPRHTAVYCCTTAAYCCAPPCTALPCTSPPQPCAHHTPLSFTTQDEGPDSARARIAGRRLNHSYTITNADRSSGATGSGQIAAAAAANDRSRHGYLSGSQSQRQLSVGQLSAGADGGLDDGASSTSGLTGAGSRDCSMSEFVMAKPDTPRGLANSTSINSQVGGWCEDRVLCGACVPVCCWRPVGSTTVWPHPPLPQLPSAASAHLSLCQHSCALHPTPESQFSSRAPRWPPKSSMDGAGCCQLKYLSGHTCRTLIPQT